MKMSLLQRVTAVEPEVMAGEEVVVAGVTAVEPDVMAGEEVVVAGVTAVEPQVVCGQGKGDLEECAF